MVEVRSRIRGCEAVFFAAPGVVVPVPAMICTGYTASLPAFLADDLVCPLYNARGSCEKFSPSFALTSVLCLHTTTAGTLHAYLGSWQERSLPVYDVETWLT